jgi:alpha-tubulin suppressor-like RCC1 family protein
MRRPVWALLGLCLASCLKDGSPTANGDTARLSLRAAVVGTPADTLDVRIAYLDQGSNGTTTPITLLDRQFGIGSGTVTVPLTIDLSTCLSDPRRVVTGPACQLDVTIRLTNAGTVVDSAVLAPIDAEPGAVITVRPAFPLAQIDTVIVVPAVDTLAVGATVQLVDTVKAANGTVETDAHVSWTSANMSVATVDTLGRVTAIAPGAAVIAASAGNKTGRAMIAVLAPPALILGASSAAFTAGRGAVLPASQSVSVTSTNAGRIVSGLAVGAPTYGAGQPSGWLSVSLSGTTTPSTLTLVPTTTNLAVGGPYTATLSVTGNGVSSQTLTVTYTIAAGPVIVASPASVSDTGVQGAPSTVRTVAVTNGGAGSLSGLSAVVSYTGTPTGWLAATLDRTTAPATLTLASTAGTLAPGSYHATVTLASSVAGVSAQTVAVTFFVETPATITVAPGSAAFTAQHAAPIPAAQTIAVGSVATGPPVAGLAVGAVTYGASQPTGWLNASLSGTTTPATLALAPNTTALAAGGPYTATVPVSGTGAATKNVTVSFTVTPAPVIAVSATSIADTVLVGAGATTGTLTVSNSGGGTLSGLSAAIAYGSGTGWLAVALNRTTAPATLTLTFTAGALAPGAYTATVTLASTVSGVAAKTVPVTFVVQTGPSIALAPASLAFNIYAKGSTLPAAQPVTVNNAGHGALGVVTVGAIAYGAGATGWLAATVSGTTVTVRVTTTNVGDGVFTASIPVSAANASNNPRPITVTLTSSVTFTKIAAGGNDFACGLTTAATVYCWGDDTYGELGTGIVGTSSSTPVAVSLPAGVTDVEAGSLYACALVGTTAYCWGNNVFGQLGTGAAGTPIATPTAVPGIQFQSISTGAEHVCGVATDNSLYCWGANKNSQLGNNSAADSVPTPVHLASAQWLSVSAGALHTCGIQVGPSLYCWGDNANAELGAGQARFPLGASAPLFIASNFVAVTAGQEHTCAIDANANGWCWGLNISGQVGVGTSADTIYSPTEIPSLKFSSMSAALAYTCGVSASTTYCWGMGTFGVIGNGSTASVVATPTAATGQTSVTSVSTAITGGRVCDIAAGVANCWGDNTDGALGSGTSGGIVASPTAVSGQPAPSGVSPSRVTRRTF